MLRQIFVFYKGNEIFKHSFAIALSDEEFQNVLKLIDSYLKMPMPGKTFHRPMSNLQIFHRGMGTLYFLFVADLADSLDYIERMLKKSIDKFKELLPDPETIKKQGPERDNYISSLIEAQRDLHSKIAIVGPTGSGRTTLFNLLKSGDVEKTIMNFARVSNYVLGELTFDLWDFQLDDNFNLLWSKFIGGADLAIIIFDASKYNLKIVTHFLNLQKREGRFSRLLLVANKSDLVSEEDIRRIKNELDVDDLKSLSLTSPEGKSQIAQLIMETLKLKKPLPPNFEKLIKDAENLIKTSNIIGAIAKYKELINICKVYQDFSHIDIFQKTLIELEKKREEQIKMEKEQTRKQKFSKPDQINFGGTVNIKSLPGVKPLPGAKPIPTSKAKLPTNPVQEKEKPQRLTLKPGDFKIQLKKDEHKVAFPVPKSKPRLGEIKIELNLPVPPSEKEILSILKPISEPQSSNDAIEQLINENNYAQALEMLITERGSTLSFSLCEEYTNELMEAFPDRTLTYNILERAADTFVKTENR